MAQSQRRQEDVKGPVECQDGKEVSTWEVAENSLLLSVQVEWINELGKDERMERVNRNLLTGVGLDFYPSE
jgi:hypothetical protein